MTKTELNHLISGCQQNDAACQKALFMHLYDYGMTIAHRYGPNLQDAEEIANDGFYKMLNNIHQYKTEVPFKLWVRKIIINTGIDFYRKNKTKYTAKNVTERTTYNEGEERLDQEYLLDLLQQLSPQYKMIFILNVIEGYSHEEISNKLNISIGTSKSNLSKARMNLRKLLAKMEINENY